MYNLMAELYKTYFGTGEVSKYIYVNIIWSKYINYTLDTQEPPKRWTFKWAERDKGRKEGSLASMCLTVSLTVAITFDLH